MTTRWISPILRRSWQIPLKGGKSRGIYYHPIGSTTFPTVNSRTMEMKDITMKPTSLSVLTSTFCRFKHSGAKMGQHLERLDELAHEQSHIKAQEKRKKKKEKQMTRKEGGQQAGASMDHTQQEEEELLYQEEDDLGQQEQQEEQQEQILPDPKQLKIKMKSIVQRFRDSLKAMRGAEPTVAMFDTVQVDAYGTRTSLQSVAQVVLVSSTLATATCFDPSLAKSVRAALAQQLNLNPSAEDGVVQIPLPRISLESRQKTASTLAKRAESYRQGIRQVRRRAMDIAKKGVAGKLEHISKDDAYRVQQDIETITEEAIQELNKAAEEKHNSIMVVE